MEQEWARLTVAQLRAQCREAGLVAQGRKAALVARLCKAAVPPPSHDHSSDGGDGSDSDGSDGGDESAREEESGDGDGDGGGEEESGGREAAAGTDVAALAEQAAAALQAQLFGWSAREHERRLFAAAPAAELRRTAEADGAARALGKAAAAAADAAQPWDALPAPRMTEELARDVQVLQLRPYIHKSRFYKRGAMREVPTHFQMGTVQEGAQEFYSSRIARKQRAPSFVQELLRDAEFRQYTKRKFMEVQERSHSGGAKAHRARLARRKAAWRR